MLFNEKLYKLRKEKNLSQEALADKLNTTRQAVSKWETGQGYPETEKLLLISNIFNVSVDYLLKDISEDESINEKGYYVSKEMAEGFILNQKTSFKTSGCGAFIFIIGVGAYLKFDNENLSPIYMLCLFIVGAFIVFKGMFLADDKYNILAKKVLIFDNSYLIDLKKNSEKPIQHMTYIFFGSFIIFMLSAIFLGLDIPLFIRDYDSGVPIHVEILIFTLAMSIPIMAYSATMLETYSLLTKNEERTHSFGFKISRKLRAKVNDLLK